MTTLTKRVAAEQLRALDLRQGDTLRVIAADGATATVQIERASETTAPEKVKPTIRESLDQLKGSVKLGPGETADDVRMAYYREKVGQTEKDDESKSTAPMTMTEFLDKWTGAFSLPSPEEIAADPRLADLIAKHVK